MPFNKNLNNPCSHENIDLIRNEVRKSKLENVVSNSFGFGGTNTSIIFSKFD